MRPHVLVLCPTSGLGVVVIDGVLHAARFATSAVADVLTLARLGSPAFAVARRGAGPWVCEQCGTGCGHCAAAAQAAGRWRQGATRPVETALYSV